MSSVFLNIISVLNGTNWQSWSESMNVYVMSKSHHHILTTTHLSVSLVIFDTDGNVDNQSNVNKTTEKQEDWDKDNKHVMGYICLRVSPDVTQLVKGKDSAKQIWDSFKKSHS
jgi:hypothetical protein